MKRLASVLTAVAIFAAWSWTLVSLLQGRVVSDPSEPGALAFQSYSSTPLSLLKLAAAIAFISAGLLAMFDGGIRVLSLKNRFLLALSVLASFCWAVLVYAPTEVEIAVRQPTSPLIWLTLIGLFVGTRDDTWWVLQPVLRAITYLTIPPALWCMFSLHHYGRFNGPNAPIQFLSLLFWLGTYNLLSARAESIWQILIRGLPVGVCIVLALFTQSRGWLILCIFSFVLLIIREARLNPETFRKQVVKLSIFATLLFLAFAYSLAVYYPTALTGLLGRITENTRTEQYRTFFAQVPLQDLLLGQGPKAGYRWGRDAHYQFFDNQLIWILFIGGIPMLATYLALIVFPGIRLFQKARTRDEFAAGGVLVLWSLAALGLSTYSGIGLFAQHYFVIALAGFAHQRIPSRAL